MRRGRVRVREEDGVVLHRGCKGERELVGKSDESEREFVSLGVMEAKFATSLLCARYGWGNCF